MQIIKDIDLAKTKEEAKKVLSSYRSLNRIANQGYEAKVTATYSFEPRSITNQVSNPMEKHIIRQEAARQLVQDIEAAINHILDAHYRMLLIEKYCKHHVKDWALMEKMELSESEFYRILDVALLWFAELYHGGERCVYKSGSFLDNALPEVL